jgi:hypothetical protein
MIGNLQHVTPDPRVTAGQIETLLKQHFHQPRFFDLYWKLVRAGFCDVSLGARTTNSLSQSQPQGAHVVIPILSHLYFHQLDRSIQDLLNMFPGTAGYVRYGPD